jgi:NhaP-type Na+/H+ or K+/H+ antiporter
VLVTSVILAYALKYLFGYSDLSLAECLVIGSVISTTDPVAVVALLKELGTSIKFNTLLEGESLLNDGTAFVFFLVCLDVVRNGVFEFWPSVIKFFRLSFGGPLFGILMGWICIAWISRILKDN